MTIEKRRHPTPIFSLLFPSVQGSLARRQRSRRSIDHQRQRLCELWRAHGERQRLDVLQVLALLFASEEILPPLSEDTGQSVCHANDRACRPRNAALDEHEVHRQVDPLDEQVVLGCRPSS